MTLQYFFTHYLKFYCDSDLNVNQHTIWLQAYVDKLSEDLQFEYGRRGLTVQCILPGLVATNMSKVRHASWMAPTPEQFVESALKRVGILQRTPGYYPHSLMVRH